MKARKRLLGAVAALNLVLLAALLLRADWIPFASAQVRGGGADYMMVVGDIQTDLQCVWAIDLASRRMITYVMDRAGTGLRPVDGLELDRAFRTRVIEPGMEERRGRR